jgi:hypothetical protein
MISTIECMRPELFTCPELVKLEDLKAGSKMLRRLLSHVSFASDHPIPDTFARPGVPAHAATTKDRNFFEAHPPRTIASLSVIGKRVPNIRHESTRLPVEALERPAREGDQVVRYL